MNSSQMAAHERTNIEQELHQMEADLINLE